MSIRASFFYVVVRLCTLSSSISKGRTNQMFLQTTFDKSVQEERFLYLASIHLSSQPLLDQSAESGWNLRWCNRRRGHWNRRRQSRRGRNRHRRHRHIRNREAWDRETRAWASWNRREREAASWNWESTWDRERTRWTRNTRGKAGWKGESRGERKAEATCGLGAGWTRKGEASCWAGKAGDRKASAY